MGPTALGRAHQVQQGIEVPRVRLPPRFGLGLRPPGVAALPVRDERAKHAGIGIGLPRAGQETATVDAFRKLAGPDQRVQFLLRVDVERVEHFLAIRRDQLGHVQQDARRRAPRRGQRAGTGHRREVAVPEDERLVPRSRALEREGDQPLRLTLPVEVAPVPAQGLDQGLGIQLQPIPVHHDRGREDPLDRRRLELEQGQDTLDGGDRSPRILPAERADEAQQVRPEHGPPPADGLDQGADRGRSLVQRPGLPDQMAQHGHEPCRGGARWNRVEVGDRRAVRAPVVRVERPDQELPRRQRGVSRDLVQRGEGALGQGTARHRGEQVTHRPRATPQGMVGSQGIGLGEQARVSQLPRQDRLDLLPARRGGRGQLRHERPDVAGGDRLALGHERHDPLAVRREPVADERGQRRRVGVQALREHRADARLVGGDDERLGLGAPRLLEPLLGEVERLPCLARGDQGFDASP